MNLHEYQAKALLKSLGIKLPKGFFTQKKEENLPLNFPFMAKVQVHAGGRGKSGGVKKISSKEEWFSFFDTFHNQNFITYQNAPHGQKVHGFYLEECLKVEREFYLSFTFNREASCPSLVVSKEGGMSIEESSSDSLLKLDLKDGLFPYQIRKVSTLLSLDVQTISSLLLPLYEFYLEKDLTLLEINPLGFTGSELILLDCKMIVDDNSLFRQKQLSHLQDLSQLTLEEQKALAVNISYVSLDGSIGCLVNGAGLAMATMDLISEVGGRPANFLDVGGGANVEGVKEAFQLLIEDPKVKVIFVNIFGGIMRCDIIAEGILKALEKVSLKQPLVVRLQGTKAEEGLNLLNSSFHQIFSLKDLKEAAKKTVELLKR